MNMAVPSINAFVDLSSIKVHFVLDAESDKDLSFGEKLQKTGFMTHYEFLPNFLTEKTIPFHGFGRYDSISYSRQLLSTFYVDLYTHSDIIGIFDCDNLFYTMPLIESIFDANGRINSAAIRGSHYKADSKMLKLNNDQTFDLDFMYTDVMPKFFFRHTFKDFRQEMCKLHNVSSFADVWALTAVDPLSPVNVLSIYGAKYKSDEYNVVLPDDPSGIFFPYRIINISDYLNAFYSMKQCV